MQKLSSTKKRIIENFVSLSVLQAANYLVPLIALPYLFRVLGSEKFGLVMFAQAFVQYFVIIIDFGLEYSATREISIHRNNPKKINEIFNAVFVIKSIMAAICIIVFSLLVLLIPKFNPYSELYFYSFLLVFGQMIFPIWLFQGIEKMKYIVVFNLISKIIFTLLIFIVITQESDYILYALLNSGSFIFSGLMALIFAIYLQKIKFYIPDSNTIKFYIKRTRDIFFGYIGMSLYMTSTPFILGLITGRNDLVGFYSVAEKTVRGIRYAINPLTQALFPHLSQKFHIKTPKESVIILHKLSLRLIPVLVFLTLGVFIFADPLTRLLTGSSNLNVLINVRIFSAILIIGTLNNIFGVLGLVNLGLEKVFRNYVLICGLVNLVMCLFLGYYFLDSGAAFSVILSESLLLLFLSYRLNKIKNYA